MTEVFEHVMRKLNSEKTSLTEKLKAAKEKIVDAEKERESTEVQLSEVEDAIKIITKEKDRREREV